jgi:hypothetical protein
MVLISRFKMAWDAFWNGPSKIKELESRNKDLAQALSVWKSGYKELSETMNKINGHEDEEEARKAYQTYLKHWNYVNNTESTSVSWVLQAMEYAAARVRGCNIVPISSRCCSRGTKSCVINHNISID